MTRRSILSRLAELFTSSRQKSIPPESQRSDESESDWDAEAAAMRTRLMDALPYPRVEVRGDRALAEWEKLRAKGEGWPVIIGNDDQLAAIADQYLIDDPSFFDGASAPATEPTPASIVAEAATLRFPDDLTGWLDADPDMPDPPLGEWPDVAPGGAGLTVATDLTTGEFYPTVHILLIPTAHGWEVPAYLRWGNWNDCPPAAFHVAALKRWHDRFGVELIGINSDTLNLRTTRRPRDRDAALTLAHEQYLYCPDIVDQGVETVTALAALLMDDDWWFFWWD